MIWTQGLLSFCVWIAYGVLRSRGSKALRVRLGLLSRNQRTTRGIAWLVGSMAAFFVGLSVVVMAGGMPKGGMTPGGWIAITLLGLGFVHGQTQGTALLVSLVQEPVTSRAAEPSGTQEQESSL